jgi:hypothetical protein
MIAVLVALAFAAHTPAHKHAHVHKHHDHVHKHHPPPVPVDRCASDAARVQELELRISQAANPKVELERLEDQLEAAVDRAHQDCGS